MANETLTSEDEQEAEKFYKSFLSTLNDHAFPFMVGGTYAVRYYTDIDRPTKDLDIFVKAGDYPRILNALSEDGYDVSIEDERWLAKVKNGRYFADIIFGSIPGAWPINEEWLKRARSGRVLDENVRITPPEELIVSKSYRLRRSQFDGADVVNLFLRIGKTLDWRRLLDLMEPNWELLLYHIILFRFIYPSERNIVPNWLMDELLSRLENQRNLPPPKDPVSRGSLVSPNQFRVAYEKWGFRDITEVVQPEDREQK